MPSKMKLDVEDQELADGAVVEEVVHPVVRGFVKDWDAMEDLLNYVLYRDIGWEIGDEGQILFTEPLFTPKVMHPPARIELVENLKSVADAGRKFMGAKKTT
jgi:actin-related protein 7, plant